MARPASPPAPPELFVDRSLGRHIAPTPSAPSASSSTGWGNCHLHEFESRGTRYGSDDDGWGDPPEDERHTRLRTIAEPGSSFLYVYDFGDDWRHRIVVEKALPTEAGARYPACTGGRRACPPEDCGGPWGYQEFLATINDTSHVEHESMLEWAGSQFDPDAFDPTDFQQRLDLGRLIAR